jgi:hypothetical protein
MLTWGNLEETSCFRFLLKNVLLRGGDYVRFSPWSNLFNSFCGQEAGFYSNFQKKCEFLAGRAFLLL